MNEKENSKSMTPEILEQIEKEAAKYCQERYNNSDNKQYFNDTACIKDYTAGRLKSIEDGWINVDSDNLPAQGERVLVYCDSGLIDRGYRIGGIWESDHAPNRPFSKRGYNVTHWRYLPSPPQ